MAPPTDAIRPEPEDDGLVWDRYCRLRETFLSVVIHASVESLTARQSSPQLRADAGHTFPKPLGKIWDRGAGRPQEPSPTSPEVILAIEPQPCWVFSADVDMAIAAVVVPPETAPPELSLPSPTFRVDDAHAEVAPPHRTTPVAAADKPQVVESVNDGTNQPSTDTSDTAVATASAASTQTPGKDHYLDGAVRSLPGPHFASRVSAGIRGGALFPIDDVYRNLRDHIMPHEAAGPLALAWMGAQALEDGASLLTGLAASLAERGDDCQVLLVDADFQVFSLSRRFRRPGSPGLGDVVAGKKTWLEAVLPTALAQIDVLPCGSLCDQQLAMLASGYWQRLLAEWKARYQYIVIDAGTPDQPSLASLLQAVDSTYVVVEYDRTSRPAMASAVDQLRRWGAANLATVMVGVPDMEYVVERKALPANAMVRPACRPQPNSQSNPMASGWGPSSIASPNMDRLAPPPAF